jgi:hypothetical protein
MCARGTCQVVARRPKPEAQLSASASTQGPKDAHLINYQMSVYVCVGPWLMVYLKIAT